MTSVESVVSRALGIELAHVKDDLEYQSVAEWDSLGHVALMVELERELHVEIGDELMLHLRSVSAIREFARTRAVPDRHVNGAARGPVVHRGLEGVHVDSSAISQVDGERGVLAYRGYDIHDLAAHSSFEETVWLLLEGDLPTAAQLTAIEAEMRAARKLPPAVVDVLRPLAGGHPMDALRTAVSALGALDGGDDRTAGIALIARLPTLIAAHHALRRGREPVEPPAGGSHAESLLRMLLDEPPSETAIRLVDRALIVHAEHDCNASAFATRVTTGCGSSLHAAVTSALAAFAGPRHGGAAEAVMQLIDEVGSPTRAAAHIRACRAENRPVMGFGHRVYRGEDPRVRHMRMSARELSAERGDTSAFDIVEAIVDAMEPYARHGVGPNVDLYAGLAYRLLGLPDDLAGAMFAAGRIAGWVAHAREQRANNVLIRPLLHFVGARDRSYRPVDAR